MSAGVTMPEIMTAEEVAKYLRVSESQIYKLARIRQIPCVRIGARRLFSRTAIDEWIHVNSAATEDQTQ